MATKKSTSKIVVLLPIGLATPINNFITEAQHIHDLLQNNTDFPTLQGDLPQLQTDITTLIADEQKTLNRVPGSAALRDEQKAIVYNELDGLRGIVQKVVNQPANIANAVAMAEGGGMEVKGRAKRSKDELTVRNGDMSGSCDLIAKAAAKKAAYLWQQSTDNINFVYCDPICTLETKNTVENLTPKTDYWFRFRAILPAKARKSKSARKLKKEKAADADWSQSVKITVV
ncbi:MAG: hypothetical protein HY063_14805 [Bacteroidetes bacterium]|nr:hypothetical protein [Bacteroidota bacterium]